MTGITNEMVAGAKIVDAIVEQRACKNVQLAISYNADFDRKFIERRFLDFPRTMPWACAYRQVPWKRYGAVGSKLDHILAALGLFHDGHRALDDCRAGLHALATAMRFVDGRPVRAMAELLDSTRSGIYRVYAYGAPFDWKDRLKARGYFWTGEKPWKKDFLSPDEATEEVDWCADQIKISARMRRIGARDRFSIRAL